MKLHELGPAPGSKRKRKRVARGHGAGQGTHAGRGIKGQGSRGGKPKGAYFEGGQLPLVRRLPFKRGFNNLFRITYQEVRLDRLVDRVEDGATITPETLEAVGLLRDASQPVALLGNGEAITKKLHLKVHRVTASAEEKIKAAGGSVEILPLKVTGLRATFRKLRKEELAKL